ncbi:MAG: acetylornithine/N-succinyldiaminopimelate aminotransferase [Arcticibacterium sp.]|jgi:acetylornithine/N-succinyldiaminopimelate aminotransferase
MPLQNELANKLWALAGLLDYKLFLANSGAEANEDTLNWPLFIMA